MLLLTNKTIDKLKYDLVREGLVGYESLNFAQDNAKKNSTNLSVELVKENIISEKDLLNFIQDKLHIPYVDLSDYTPDKTCLKYVSAEDARRYNIFPLFKIEDVLTIAMSDPLDLFAINTIFQSADFSIEPVVCAQESISEAVKIYYSHNNISNNFNIWQDIIISSDLDEEKIKQAITLLLQNAIDEKQKNVFFERINEGIRVYFNKTEKGFIPNILATRFINELASNFLGINSIDEDIPINSKFDFRYNNSVYSIITAFLPTKFGSRIALDINKPLTDLPEDFTKKLSEILKTPSIVKIENKNDDFIYSIAKFLGEKFRVLMIERCVKYNLANVAQIETNKNIGIYFDEILNQIEVQNFEIIFFEKIYTKEQFEKLKLLSKERTIFTCDAEGNNLEYDFTISKNGKLT